MGSGIDYGVISSNAMATAGHFGRFDVAQQSISLHCENCAHLACEPDQKAQLMDITFGLISIGPLWLYIMGRSADMTQIMEDFGYTWKLTDAKVDEHATSVGPLARQRGDKTFSKTAFFDIDALSWTIKAVYALNAGADKVTKQEILASLPTAEAFRKMNILQEKAGAVSFLFVSPYPYMAAMCEMVDAREEALEFASVGLDDTITNGGDPKPTSQIILQCVRGRMLALQGRAMEAVQAFEAASTIAARCQFWLLNALALRDMIASAYGENKRWVRDKERCKRRLASVVQELGGPSRELGDVSNSAFVFDSNLEAIRLAGLDSIFYPP